MTGGTHYPIIVEFECENCRYRVIRTERGWVHAITGHPSCGAGKLATPVGVRDAVSAAVNRGR
jgi:hypothetical protein